MKIIRKHFYITGILPVAAERISSNFDNTKADVIRMLSGENVDVNPTSYMNTMTDFQTEGDVFTYKKRI